MVPSRRIRRGLWTVAAMAQVVAPLAALLVDARPSAVAIAARTGGHVEAPGSTHPVAHPEHCALCGLESADGGMPPVRPTYWGVGATGLRPVGGWRNGPIPGAVRAAGSRAPPV